MTPLFAIANKSGSVEVFADPQLRTRLARFEVWSTLRPRAGQASLTLNLQEWRLIWVQDEAGTGKASLRPSVCEADPS